MGRKRKLISTEELIKEESERLQAQINLLKRFIDENRSLAHFSQIIDKIPEEKRTNTELENYALKKCLTALKTNDDIAYYYLSVLYFLKEKLKIESLNSNTLTEFKKRFTPQTEKEKIILRELEFLFQDKEQILKPSEVETKYGIETRSNETTLILPQNFILNVHDTSTTKAITIDPSSDITLKDDALSVKEAPDHYVLGIHISDLSSFIVPNQALDIFARKQFRTLYLPDKVHHMLPFSISKSYLSLEQNMRRNVISLYLTITKQGTIIKEEFVRENIEIEKNLTYLECENILRSTTTTTPELERTLKLLDHIIYLLNGTYSLTKIMEETECDDELEESHRSMLIVQSCMVLYNSILAKTMSNNKDIPFVYRVHKKPTQERIYENGQDKNNIAQFYEESYYSLENIGHYGLNAEYYTHATAGIRRYMDYTIQTLYHASLQKLSVEELKELERNIIALVEYANKKEKEIRTFLPEYAYSYHKHFTLP